jgi:hypothetical protein
MLTLYPCDYCGAEYASPSAAAVCCDPDLPVPMD